jgi:plastocyanin
LVAVLVIGLGVAGCGSGSSSKPKSQGCVAVAAGKVTVDAKNLAFSQSCITAPANTPLAVTFANKDSGTPHDWVLKGTGQKVGSPLITGGKDATVKVPALKPGNYTYVCTVHPNMTGTLEVAASTSAGTSPLPGR